MPAGQRAGPWVWPKATQTGTLCTRSDVWLGIQTGIYVAGGTNTGSSGQGQVEIYNNTLYDCGSREGSDSGMLSRGSGSPQLILLLKNNLVYALQGEAYLTPASASQQV